MKFHNLHAYSDIELKPMIEEDPKDIFLAIEYNDHGDDFLYIETKSGERFTYGYFVNRYGYPDYNELDEPWCQNSFLRKPKMYKKEDRYSTSNNLIWRLEDYIYNRMNYRSLKPANPQFNFKMALLYIDAAYNSGCRYDLESYRNYLYNFLKDNDIATEENLLLAKKAKFNSRINGVDGEAGKIASDGFIVCDRLHYVCVNGKCIKLSKVKKEYGDDDEWGVSSMYVDANQFNSMSA